MDENNHGDMTAKQPTTSHTNVAAQWRNRPASEPFLVILSGVEKGKKILIVSRTTVLGRSVHCNIQVKDPRSSRSHAEIHREESGFSIVDLNSSNGTLVNGNKIKKARLKSGDRIIIGSTEMIFTIPVQGDEPAL